MTNLKEIREVAEKFGNDVELIEKAIRNIQSIKSRLKKQKAKVNYQAEMNEVLRQEQVLKEAKQMLEPKKKAVTMFEQADVEQLDYDETVKALKSIQSKKTLSQFLTDNIETNEVYQSACRIEEMLKEHRAKIKPVDEMNLRKTDLQTLIEMFESTNITKKEMIARLKELAE